MKRAVILVLLLGATLTNAVMASAAPRTLFHSDSLQIVGRLTPTRLILLHTNLTDFPIDLHCKTRVEGVRYRTHGTLYPHEIWKTSFRSSADKLRGATTSCHVTVHDDFSILYKGEKVEVLARGFIQPSGDPQTDFYFYSITGGSVTFTCTWQEGDPPYPQEWTETLTGYDYDSLSSGGTDINTVSNFGCTES